MGLLGLSYALRKARYCVRDGVRALASRPSSEGLSLDTTLLQTNPDLVLSHLKARRSGAELLAEVGLVGALRQERNAKIVEGDAAKNVRKTLSQQIGQAIKEGKQDVVLELKCKVEEASTKAAMADQELQRIDGEINKIFPLIPNLLDDRVPDGSDDTQNPIVFQWGDEYKKVGSSFLWHDEIALKIKGLDVDAAARISGARFSVLKGSIARLERSIIQYFLDFHVSRGYEEVSVPYIVSRSTLEGTGQLPKFEDDLFKVSHSVAGEDAFLIPTAEVPVTNLYRDQLLDGAQLPIAHVCHSPSFRAEAGSYGRDTRGLLRQHQFHKVELVKICTAETSKEEHEKMAGDAEALLQSLKLPYRKVLLCSGDIGFSARICYDIEVWLPGQQMYREISSISNCGDFQARRMSLRYRPTPLGADTKGKKSTAYPHTLNGSGVAVGRALVAILENYFDGTGVVVPDALRSYMGGVEKIT
jgi:seryl-tRNA synthetase